MKRILSLFLVLSLLLCTAAALAEGNPFELRNGVKFGDTEEEVKSKETLGFDPQYCEPYSLYTYGGTVAGIDGTKLWYRFNEDNGQLYEVRWSLPKVTSESLSTSHYQTLYNGLVTKYGEPLGYKDGACYVITGSAIQGGISMANIYSDTFTNGVGELMDYAEWDVVVGDGHHVKIELCQFMYGVSYEEREYGINLGYTPFTDEELEAATSGNTSGDDSVLNDL